MVIFMTIGRSLATSIVIVGCVVIGCGGGPAKSGETSAQGSASGTAKSSASNRGQTAAAALTNIADLFPPGPGRDEVFNNCASCHNVACSAIGQRTRARWDALKQGHADRVPGQDLNIVFNYLKANFDDSKPEPKIAPQLLEGGC